MLTFHDRVDADETVVRFDLHLISETEADLDYHSLIDETMVSSNAQRIYQETAEDLGHHPMIDGAMVCSDVEHISEETTEDSGYHPVIDVTLMVDLYVYPIAKKVSASLSSELMTGEAEIPLWVHEVVPKMRTS